jgi:hypothetical protein
MTFMNREERVGSLIADQMLPLSAGTKAMLRSGIHGSPNTLRSFIQIFTINWYWNLPSARHSEQVVNSQSHTASLLHPLSTVSVLPGRTTLKVYLAEEG